MDIKKAAASLERAGFTVSLFESGSEAAAHICADCAGKTVGIGGSMTVKQLGLREKLMEKSTVFSHLTDGNAAMEMAASAQVYISSANAISETGEIINIDGRGNRVASTLFGHSKVYIICGVNKLAPDFASAMHRARNIAAPLNARRLGRKTPCALGGELKCYDCNSPERICRAFVVTTRPMMETEDTEIVLINEELGY